MPIEDLQEHRQCCVWGFVLTSSVGAHGEPCAMPDLVAHKCHL